MRSQEFGATMRFADDLVEQHVISIGGLFVLGRLAGRYRESGRWHTEVSYSELAGDAVSPTSKEVADAITIYA